MKAMDAFDPSPTPARRPPRLIALMNQKGGVGKTTTAVNLGAGLADLGQRVLLVDLDPQAHLSLHVGVEPEANAPTVYDLLVDPDVSASAVISPIGERLEVVASEVDLAAAEVELSNRPERERILARKLAEVRDRYDVILFDCPPSLGLLTLNALAAATEVMVPMQAHFLPLQGVGKLLETVGMVRRSVNPALRVTGIILCAFESNTTLASEIVADLNGFFADSRGQEVPWRECRILEPAIRRNIKLAEAPSFGKTIFDYAPWCAGANDYRLLAERMIESWGVGRASSRPRRSVLRRADEPADHAETSNATAAAPHGADIEVKSAPGAEAREKPLAEMDALRAEIESLDRIIHDRLP